MHTVLVVDEPDPSCEVQLLRMSSLPQIPPPPPSGEDYDYMGGFAEGYGQEQYSSTYQSQIHGADADAGAGNSMDMGYSPQPPSAPSSASRNG